MEGQGGNGQAEQHGHALSGSNQRCRHRSPYSLRTITEKLSAEIVTKMGKNSQNITFLGLKYHFLKEPVCGEKPTR